MGAYGESVGYMFLFFMLISRSSISFPVKWMKL